MPIPDTNNTNIIKVAEPAPLTNDQMLKMLLDTQKQFTEALKEQSAAILQARIPYVDPKVIEAKLQALKERQAEVAQKLRIKIATKAQCPHVRDNGTPNIKWMEHSNGITLGVCGGCFSEFDTRNPKDYNLLRQDPKSIRNMGRAGSHAKRGGF